jgi:hypothetical protein
MYLWLTDLADISCDAQYVNIRKDTVKPFGALMHDIDSILVVSPDTVRAFLYWSPGDDDLSGVASYIIRWHKLTGDTTWQEFTDTDTSAYKNLNASSYYEFEALSVDSANNVENISGPEAEYSEIEESNNKRPEIFALQISPNPFNPSCQIITLTKATVEIFNINGKCLAKLSGGTQIWRPEKEIGSGIYLIRAKIGEKEITKRVVYLK